MTGKTAELPPHCTICDRDDLEMVMPLGPQPLSTCFAGEPRSRQALPTHELSLGFCRSCAAMQLVARFPLALLQGKSPAGRFREPQAHLPAVVDKLTSLQVVNQQTRLLGLSYIDTDLLNLLASHGCTSIKSVNFAALAPWQLVFGLETMQSIISGPGAVDRIRTTTGPIDVVCARFLLEHAESAHAFLGALVDLVRPCGHIVVEVPDADKMLTVGNHALIWEDHFTYFSAASLARLAAGVSATVLDISRYSYAYEDALVAILRVGDGSGHGASSAAPAEVAATAARVQAFARGFAARRISLRAELNDRIAKGERLAVFGAGHHAAKYINFYGIADLIEFAVDDNPMKRGLYMPGTDLCIRDSQFLLDSQVTTCLSTLSPETESKARQSLAAFFDRGGMFIPTFEPTEAENGA